MVHYFILSFGHEDGPKNMLIFDTPDELIEHMKAKHPDFAKTAERILQSRKDQRYGCKDIPAKCYPTVYVGWA